MSCPDPRSAERPTNLVHQVLPFVSEQEFADVAVPFLRSGVSRGERVLCISAESNAALVRQSLEEQPDRVEFVDPARWYSTPARTLAACHGLLRRAQAAGAPVRMLAEPPWNGLDAGQLREWLRFEALLNLAFAEAPLWALCAYDRRRVDPELLAHARRTHPHLVEGAGTSYNDGYVDPLDYSAEFDRGELPEPSSVIDARPIALGALGENRRALRELAIERGLSTELADDFVLAVDEVASNALRHGGGTGVQRLWAEEHHLVCEVRDQGGGIGVPLPGLLPPDEGPGGFGLWTARQLCDLVQVRTTPNGTTVRLHLRTD